MTSEENNNSGISLGQNFADLLTRVDQLPLETIVETAAKYNCRQDFAGIVYLLHNDLDIAPELIIADFHEELDRLKRVKREVPEIETYMYKFAIEEGKWIAFLRGTFPNKLRQEAKKIQPSFDKISKLKGSDLVTLATQIMMDRQFIGANTIVPVILRWVEEHKEGTNYDAIIRLVASILEKPCSDEIIEKILTEQKNLREQLEVLGEILSNAGQSNWIIRSLIEAEILYEDYESDIKGITYKGAADLVLWMMIERYGKEIGSFTVQQDMSRMIMRFQLESDLGIKTASPMAVLEYNLLNLAQKDELAREKLAEEMIKKAFKSSRLESPALDVGREILALLIDHSTLPGDFTGKIPTHFDFTIKHYKSNPIRLNRALDRWKVKGKEPTDVEMQEAVILDYLVQFVHNYILNKRKADPKDLEIPDMPKGLDLADGEKEIIEMIDAALQRGMRSNNIKKALDIFENQVQSMYNRLLALINDEISVGESILYGIFNMNDIEISRDDALELIQKHFRRMKVSVNSSGKKRIDSAVIKAVCIEVEEKVLKRAMK